MYPASAPPPLPVTYSGFVETFYVQSASRFSSAIGGPLLDQSIRSIVPGGVPFISGFKYAGGVSERTGKEVGRELAPWKHSRKHDLASMLWTHSSKQACTFSFLKFACTPAGDCPVHRLDQPAVHRSLGGPGRHISGPKHSLHSHQWEGDCPVQHHHCDLHHPHTRWVASLPASASISTFHKPFPPFPHAPAGWYGLEMRTTSTSTAARFQFMIKSQISAAFVSASSYGLVAVPPAGIRALGAGGLPDIAQPVRMSNLWQVDFGEEKGLGKPRESGRSHMSTHSH
jgi:hypothetical protein